MSKFAQHALNQIRMVRIKQQLEGLAIAEDVQVQAIACLEKALNDHQLLLDIDHLNQQIAGIVVTAAKEGKLDSLSADIALVAAQYPLAREKATEDLNALHSLHPSIYQSLKQEGQINYRVLGQDVDIERVLGDVLTKTPDQIVRNGRHILQAVSIDTPLDVEARMQEFALANTDKNFTLLIPVNSHQSHWRLAEIQMCGVRVEKATLYDPMANASLAKSDAYQNLEKATGVKPLAIPVATQSNTVDCLPHVMQIAVHIAKPGLSKDDSLEAIRNARTSAQAREACVGRMVKLDNGKELGHVVLPSRENAEVSTTDLEREIESNKAIQLEIDREMAENLQALYDSAGQGADEKELVAQARQDAFKTVGNRHRMFAAKSEQAADVPGSPGLNK